MALNVESLFATWSYAKKIHNVPNAMRFAFNHEFSSKNDDFHFEPKQNQSYHKSNKSCLSMQKRNMCYFHLYCHKNLGKIVGEKRQLNRVLMHFVKNRDVFAQKRQNMVFHALLYVGREFHKVEEIIQNVNH